jgi:undecaprenyl-diphosphatase
VTLAVGLARGLEREAAARFAFLMGIPIIAGAGLWKARTLVDPSSVAGPSGLAGPVDLGVLLAGMIAAAVAGWFAIGILLRYLRTHDLGIFIAYRLVLAAVVAILLLAR